jgi:hypothetical protein
MSAKKMVAGGIVATALVLAVIYKRTTYEPPPPPPPPATTVARSAYRPPTVIVQKVQISDNLYRFTDEPSGCVTRYIAGKLRAYPKGGSVWVTAPGGEKFVDTPGVDLPDRQFPDGTWTWCRKDPGATGVQILN